MAEIEITDINYDFAHHERGLCEDSFNTNHGEFSSLESLMMGTSMEKDGVHYSLKELAKSPHLITPDMLIIKSDAYDLSVVNCRRGKNSRRDVAMPILRHRKIRLGLFWREYALPLNLEDVGEDRVTKSYIEGRFLRKKDGLWMQEGIPEGFLNDIYLYIDPEVTTDEIDSILRLDKGKDAGLEENTIRIVCVPLEKSFH